MYQSFPQRHISRSNSAMPIAKEISKNPCVHNEQKKDCHKNVPSLCEENKKNPISFFENLKIDDIILIGIILVLLYEGSTDILTLAILAAVLFL